MTRENLTQAAEWRALVGNFYFVDVGSRGGFHDMSLLHPLINMYSLDADETTKPPCQDFASIHHFPFALSSSTEERDLIVTSHPGMSSLLKFDEHVFTRHFGLIPGSQSWKQTLAPVGRQNTSTHKADDFFRSQNLMRIDFLKLDTQGTELEILRGASEYLSSGRISVIKTEVSFIPVYENQCTFSEIDQFLKAYGFIFVDCAFYPDAVFARKRETAIKHIGSKEQPRFSSAGDAIYVLDPAHHAESDRAVSTLRSAIVLNQLGYVSLAFDLLKGCGYEREAVKGLLRETAMTVTVKTKAKQLLKLSLPPWAYRRTRWIYRSLFSSR